MGQYLELKALLERATAGDWAVEVEAEPEEGIQPEVYICHPGTVCDVTVVATMSLSDRLPLEQKKADAELLVAAKSQLPSLLDELERLRGALTSIAEGNLGSSSWQANYDRIRDTARLALDGEDGDG